MNRTVLNSVETHGGRTSRYGDFSVVRLHSCSFVTTPLELQQHQNWARGRMSCGNAVRDRAAFTDRFETIIARSGSGIRTKGSRGLLQRLVKSMKANALVLSEWSIPHDINDSVEIKRKVKKAPDPAPDAATGA